MFCHFACMFMACYFFFSSRRRHTRFSRDWSSDVCSSDLASALLAGLLTLIFVSFIALIFALPFVVFSRYFKASALKLLLVFPLRSEERRVGKECRVWW